jgi:hypothetical protein
MSASRAHALAPPEGLRPAQVGIVLVGRLVAGHVSATLADLAQRGFLGMDAVDGAAGADWVLTDLRARTAARPLGFEVTLLDGLFGREPVVRLSEVGPELLPVLSRFRAQLGRDAAQRGWLRRWRRGQRTPRGEQLLREIHGFRWELRALAAAGDSQALGNLAPYAMVFGLMPAVASMADTPDSGGARSLETEVAWSKADRFARSWLGVCAGFPAGAERPHRPGRDWSGDFVHEWSAPHGQHSPGHDSGHAGYGGGYEGHGGGQHGGFHGGHSGY